MSVERGKCVGQGWEWGEENHSKENQQAVVLKIIYANLDFSTITKRWVLK